MSKKIYDNGDIQAKCYNSNISNADFMKSLIIYIIIFLKII